ncbi:MAG: hypothetical protein AAFN76_10650 [Pseudomonadota bacterium]
MTTVNGQFQQPPVVQPKDKQLETKVGEFFNSGTTRHQRENQHHSSGGQLRSNSSVMVSQNAFEQLLEMPKGQQKQDSGTASDQHDEEGHNDPAQVLITLSPEKVVSKAEPMPQPAQSAIQHVKVEEITKLVSRQMDAALRSGPVVTQYPLSMAIPLDTSTGLKEVQVVLNDGMLAVTLTRSAEQAMHDIKLAALNLAQILQSRYPAKTIKISEKVDGEVDGVEATAPDEMSPRPRIFDNLSSDTVL